MKYRIHLLLSVVRGCKKSMSLHTRVRNFDDEGIENDHFCGIFVIFEEKKKKKKRYQDFLS